MINEIKNEIILNNEIDKSAYAINGSHMGLMTGDALKALKELPSDSFNVAITSPPYYWVRDYDVDGQLGHEDTVEEYVSKLADIFDQVKRVLRPDGVFYLNIGDTYYSGNGQPHGQDPRSSSRNFMRKKLRAVDKSGWAIPKKSLIGVPWKVAFELQSRGWVLRSDIIWVRHNAFSEPSAVDRPWRKYEHLFLFAKSRFYCYDRTALNGYGDVWEIPIERMKYNNKHPAPFPTKLVEKCILTGSPLGGIVIDPFLGSGTALLIASKMGRHCVGIDIKEDYIKEVAKKIEKMEGKEELWGAFLLKLSQPIPDFEKWLGSPKSKKRT